ncbi:hypothetical protein ABIA03_000449 [Bradyrhizobium yuanmingense]|uniref:Uncharacterized protein n=1 Tax=Bradyrhizobium yuanmingense TaxID=108015 RepID=A0ABV4GS49_9BRAD
MARWQCEADRLCLDRLITRARATNAIRKRSNPTRTSVWILEERQRKLFYVLVARVRMR